MKGGNKNFRGGPYNYFNIILKYVPGGGGGGGGGRPNIIDRGEPF